MRIIVRFIVLSAIYGIIEEIMSFNIFEKYFVGDYIRGYYGTSLYRIASIYMHPIACAQIFLIGFWMTAFFYKSWRKWIYLVIIALGIYYTKSRGIWGGLLASIVIVGLMQVVNFFRQHKVRKKRIFYIPICVILIGILYKFGVFNTIIIGITERILAASGSTSELARQSMSIYTINYMIHNASWIQKLIGYGIDSSKAWIYNSGAYIKAFDAIDNSYLTIFYEFGCFGIVTIIGLFVKTIKISFFRKNKNTQLDKAVLMSLIACIVPFYFYDFYGWLPIYLLFIYCTVPCIGKDK